MENFKNSLDLSIFDELPREQAFQYIKDKYWEEVLKQIIKILNK